MIDGIWKPDAERLKSCHEEITRISRMVGDLEKLARYESENVLLNRIKFDISDMIRRIIHNFENDFLNKGVHILFQGEKTMICADRNKISQVVVNLISNALKYTHKGGKVQINVEDKGDNVEIRVKDNGIGISKEDLPYIFERFYRADKSRSRLSGGSGIGLTIAKAIVEAHKGYISVESRLGEGTEFIVVLPKNFYKSS